MRLLSVNSAAALLALPLAALTAAVATGCVAQPSPANGPTFRFRPDGTAEEIKPDVWAGAPAHSSPLSTPPAQAAAPADPMPEPAPAPAAQPAPAPAPAPVAAAPKPVEPAAGQAGGTWTVQKGDTLYSISRAVYGSDKKVKDIVAANPGLTPNKIKVGQKIKLP